MHYTALVVGAEVLRDQILHTSLSHDASCCKNAQVELWNSTYTAKVLHTRNMRDQIQNYTQFSQFDESRTLLSVCGVRSRTHAAPGKTAGTCCPVQLSGWTRPGKNKNRKKCILKALLVFFNRNASSVRPILVANCEQPHVRGNPACEPLSWQDEDGDTDQDGEDSDGPLYPREKRPIFTTGSLTYTPH